ncbi:hypothetical protein WBJ53_14830 [Spirosoma sp. SC4-14]|uniref:hypothetical protein n=1 Tax=Spirosoma sp. SC4-14 TaxID=3128900 RepID=UPI0030D05FC2
MKKPKPIDDAIAVHFYEQVLPAYQEYLTAIDRGEGGGIKIMGPAKVLTEYLFHLRDRLEPYHQEKTFTRKKVALLFPEFDLIGDIANAMKHGQLTFNPNKQIEDITSIQEKFVTVFFRNSPQPMYGYSQLRILVTLLTGEVKDLLEICINVLNFWADYLKANGFIKYTHRFTYKGDDVLDRIQVTSFKSLRINVHFPGDFNVYISERSYSFKSKKWLPYR